MGWPFRVHICASTAYNYIRAEIFGDDLTVEMLPQHGKRRRKPERPEGSIPRKPAGKSIEKRPEIVDTRTTFGHWEMDSLESGKGFKRTWLMLTERKTRRGDHRPHEGQDQRERRPGPQRHRAEAGRPVPRIFVTITCDNGTEFADAEGIESKRRGKGKRTTVYYCHPYTPSERGTNENQNGLIRRLVPKGDRPRHPLAPRGKGRRGMAQQLPPQNVRFSVRRAAFNPRTVAKNTRHRRAEEGDGPMKQTNTTPTLKMDKLRACAAS